MPELFKTNLVLSLSPLPADFEGTPQELAESIVERLEIQSPSGSQSFVIGDNEPSSNQGPWLKGGTEWYVFKESEGRYVPLEIQTSVERLFTISSSEPTAPTGDDATIWLRTVSGRVIGWYFWNGTVWRPGGNVPPSGDTASRPLAPIDYEQYFDTDINCLIHWERGSWRTVSGSPGDVKMVMTELLSEALTNNPGWIAINELNTHLSGRTLGIASKDPGDSPEVSYTVDSGISARVPLTLVGAETHILAANQIPQHTHAMGTAQGITGSAEKYLRFFRVDNTSNEIGEWPSPAPPEQARTPSFTGGFTAGQVPIDSTGYTGKVLVTTRQLSDTLTSFYGASAAHNNMQPTVFLWTLVKQ